MTILRFSSMSRSLRLRSRRRFVLVALATLMLLPAAAHAADEEEMTASILPAPPDWVTGLEASGRFVNVEGSESKFREDQNIQSGATVGASAYEETDRAEIISVDGIVQPVERQGFGRFDYDRLGAFSFDADVQAWTEFYNTRTGFDDSTVFGTRLDGSGVFPFTTNSRAVFGGGKPSADWLTVNAGADAELPGPFNDVYGDILYRQISGEMSLLKGSTVVDPAATFSVVAGSGPGTIAFDFPGRKDVDFETIGGLAGVRSSLGEIAWRFDVTAFRHEFETDTREANFASQLLPLSSGCALCALQSYREDTEITTASANLVGSRQLTPDLFVYGGGVVAWAESTPEPSQVVQSGFLPAATTSVLTRQTRDSEITRFSESFNTGLVYHAMPSVVISADVAVRASQQEGDLTELRNESTLLTGDTGTVVNNSNRDQFSVLAKGDVTWKATRRFTMRGDASYKFMNDTVDSSRVFGFVVGQAAEIEDYEMNRERIKVGASGRYRFRAGRRLEIGYDFQFDGADTDINQLANQFVVADYTRLLHRVYARFSGKIVNKVRGELRAHYTFEERDMDAPFVNNAIVPGADNGEVQITSWSISPTVSYQHSSSMSGFLNATVGELQWDLENAGPAPTNFGSRQYSSFEYDALTGTATIGMNWTPVERLKTTASYTIYANTDSVENLGHNALIRGAFELDDHWDLNSGIRYIGFNPDNNKVDDYDTVIVTLGFSGRF